MREYSTHVNRDRRCPRRVLVLLFAEVALLAVCGCSREVTHEGRPIEYWVTQMTSPDSAARHRAIEAFAHDAGQSPLAARALLAVLSTEQEADIHATIADALGVLGSNALETAPALVRLLGDEHELVRVRAATALGNIGTTSPLVVPALTRALADDDHDVRAAASAALGHVGVAAAAAVPALATIVATDRIWFVRLQATKALGLIHAQPDIAVPVLAASLRTDWPTLREAALEALARYGRAAASVSGAIRAASRDSSLEVRASAIRALAAVTQRSP